MLKRKFLVIIFISLLFSSSSLVIADENREEEEEEAGYGGLARFGFVLITIGVVFYPLVKRAPLIDLKKSKEMRISIHSTMPFLRVKFPLRLLEVHHILVIIGSALTLPHFISCNDYGNPFGLTGLLLGIALLVENISGFYGRYLHVKIERLRKQVNNSLLKEFLKKFRAWRTVHSVGTILLYILLAVHVALAD